MREERGLPVANGIFYHCVFENGSDTDVVAVAGILAKLYKACGILKDDRVTAVTRSDLVVERIGQSEIKTKMVVETALGGILLIKKISEFDTNNSFDYEVFTNLLCMIKEYGKELCIILAGNSDCVDNFRQSNPGFEVRTRGKVKFD